MHLNQGADSAALAASSLSLNLESAGRQLEIISRFSDLSQLQREAILVPGLKAMQQNLNFAADAMVMEIGETYLQQQKLKQTLEYWQEIPAALWRRVAHEFFSLGGIIHVEVDKDQENAADDNAFMLPSPDFARISDPEFYRQTRWAINFVYRLNSATGFLFSRLIEVAARIEEIVDLGNSVLKERLKCEKLLATTVNSRRWFAGLKVLNRYGHSLIDFSQNGIDPDLDDYEICQRLAAGKSFWVGSVFFSEQAAPFLQVAVPIKDRHRNVSGAIRAALNLATQKELLRSMQFESDQEILVLDRDFNLIMSSRQNRKINQISFLKTMVENSKTSDVSSQYFNDSLNSSDIFIVPLSKFRKDFLPDWRIALIQQRAEISWFSYKIPDFALFVLAVAGLYVLFYTAVQLSKLYLQDMSE